MPDPTLRAHSPHECVAIERIKQDVKWGEQNHEDPVWGLILGEEFGEAMEAALEARVRKEQGNANAQEWADLLEYELIQVAAVAVSWVECIRRREDAKG